jgi:hypothetical protein
VSLTLPEGADKFRVSCVARAARRVRLDGQKAGRGSAFASRGRARCASHSSAARPPLDVVFAMCPKRTLRMVYNSF